MKTGRRVRELLQQSKWEMMDPGDLDKEIVEKLVRYDQILDIFQRQGGRGCLVSIQLLRQKIQILSLIFPFPSYPKSNSSASPCCSNSKIHIKVTMSVHFHFPHNPAKPLSLPLIWIDTVASSLFSLLLPTSLQSVLHKQANGSFIKVNHM